MHQGPDPFAFFAGIGVLVFLSCAGYCLVRYIKHKFPSNMAPPC
jgi:hypothetical protein